MIISHVEASCDLMHVRILINVGSYICIYTKHALAMPNQHGVVSMNNGQGTYIGGGKGLEGGKGLAHS